MYLSMRPVYVFTYLLVAEMRPGRLAQIRGRPGRHGGAMLVWHRASRPLAFATTACYGWPASENTTLLLVPWSWIDRIRWIPSASVAVMEVWSNFTSDCSTVATTSI